MLNIHVNGTANANNIHMAGNPPTLTKKQLKSQLKNLKFCLRHKDEKVVAQSKKKFGVA